MTAEKYAVGTVARVRVGEWEGRAIRGRDELGVVCWILIEHPNYLFFNEDRSTVFTLLAVELPAPVAEPKAFGARVEFGPEGERDEAVRTNWYPVKPFFTRDGRDHCDWTDLDEPVVLHDPEADR